MKVISATQSKKLKARIEFIKGGSEIVISEEFDPNSLFLEI